MPDRFLSSDEYGEQAHRLYDDGDYDAALEVLKEGLSLYPNSVELSVGMGYARLAREEFAWARRAFEQALVLDPAHEDALVGMGETLLRFGEHDRALRLFREVRTLGHDDDLELVITMGRALFREGLYMEARDVFGKAVATHPDSAEAVASLGYVFHHLGDEVEAVRQVRRALRLDPDLSDARIFLGHLLYERGDWEAALREFERVPPPDHWDPLAVWRVVEVKRALWRMESGDARLIPWEVRLEELESLDDPVDRLLAEVEVEMAGRMGKEGFDPGQLELFQKEDRAGEKLRIRASDGRLYRGGWHEIVRQMRDEAGFAHENLSQYMRRMAERWHERLGVEIPFMDPESFLKAAIQAGVMSMERDDEDERGTRGIA